MKHVKNETNKTRQNNHMGAKPYMGDLTSAQIGSMAKAGQLGGEMVRRMVQQQELNMVNDTQNQD